MSTETVPKGYKRTEVGVIPEEWNVRFLPEICRFRGGKAHEQFISDLGQYICVNSKFISTEGAIRKHSSANFCSANTGDILMVMSDLPNGKALAKAYIADQDNLYAINQRVCALTPYRDSSKYLFYILNRNPYFLKFDNGVSQTHLLNPVFKQCSIQVPEDIEEQQAIAAALSDADALIESLEQLLAKKRQIKQGAMQELLTGKRRLPGFTGKWETKALGDLFTVSGGVSASRDQLSSSGHCYLHYGDIHVSLKNYVDVRKEETNLPKLDIPLGKVPAASLLKSGDVVFVDASEDDAGTSKHFVIYNEDNIPYISGLHTIVAKSKEGKLDQVFNRYCFQTKAVRDQFKFYAVGTKVSGVSKTNIIKIEITFPPLPEQTAIASVLSDMDAELEALEAKLDKARQVKQGMMQQLLTGKVRLI